MKKVFILMLCLLAVFAVVSCKHEPEQPNEPVVENGGTLTIRPAVADPTNPESTINWGTQTSKFQFTMKQAIQVEEDEDCTIEFLMKVSADVTKVDVRDGSAHPDYPVWGSGTISSLTPDDDGWYSVKVTATSTCDKIGFTVRIPTQNPDIFISIKNLKIDGEIVDFSEVEPEKYVETFLGVPGTIAVTYTE